MTVAQPAARGRGGVTPLAAALPVACGLLILGLYVLVETVLHRGTPVGACPTNGLDTIEHWDGNWYGLIATFGYVRTPIEQQPTVFFPLAPGFDQGLHQALPVLSLRGAALCVDLLAMAIALVLLDRTVAGWATPDRALLCAVVVAVPGAFFDVALYSEALFTLAVALTLWACARPGRLPWAALGVTLATLDRANGFLLILLPLGALLLRRRRDASAVGILAAACAGLPAVLAVYHRGTGNALAFLSGRRAWGAVGSGLAAFAVTHGPVAGARWVVTALAFGTPADVRGVQADSPWVTSIGVIEALAVLPLLLLAWRWNRVAGVYSAAAWVVTVLFGGLVSQARYLAVILPLWIGLVAAVRGTAWRGLVGAGVVAGIGYNVILANQYALCRWAG